jgi:hypothetical protein
MGRPGNPTGRPMLIETRSDFQDNNKETNAFRKNYLYDDEQSGEPRYGSEPMVNQETRNDQYNQYGSRGVDTYNTNPKGTNNSYNDYCTNSQGDQKMSFNDYNNYLQSQHSANPMKASNTYSHNTRHHYDYSFRPREGTEDKDKSDCSCCQEIEDKYNQYKAQFGIRSMNSYNSQSNNSISFN